MRAFDGHAQRRGALPFSLGEKVAGEAGRMRVRAAMARRKQGVQTNAVWRKGRLVRVAGTLIRRFAPPSPRGRRGFRLAVDP
jgi:hypothetical protein